MPVIKAALSVLRKCQEDPPRFLTEQINLHKNKKRLDGNGGNERNGNVKEGRGEKRGRSPPM